MCTGKIGYRWVIALTIFFNTNMNYMLRVNISVNIVAMVPTSNVTNDLQNTLDWTPYQRAQVLSSYFWGYLVANLIGGVFAIRYGPRLTCLVVIAIGALLTILCPPAAKHSSIMMIIVRTAIGFCSGFLYPTMSILIEHWAVPHERGKFLGAIIGGAIGTFFTWTLCGVIIEYLGWEWGFYTFGIIALIWCVPWWFVAYDSPDEHPKISTEELNYITEGTKHTKILKRFPPYRRMLMSFSVWIALVHNFGTGFGINFVITAAPSYLSNVLGYNISSTGALSGIIYLFRSFACFGFGAVGDFLLKRNIVSLSALRRVATVGSHIIPGGLLMCITIPGYSPIVYVVLIILALTLNGQVTLSSAANPYDLTSNFVGALTGMTAAVITAGGIITPFVTAYFTKYNETKEEAWRPVFYTGALVYIITGLIFILFGSTKKQDWDETEQIEKESS